MDENLLTILSANANLPAGAGASSAGVAGTSRQGARTEMPNNALLDALTERLQQQGQGISSSASSELQSAISEAMAGTQRAGELTTERLQSERQREIAFARDRAGTTYTTALEGRKGYATQVAALRELTETTEKSVRDLDDRYQEAILANDANTASQLADLRMQKLEFQQQQEQNFFQNVLSAANMQQSAIDSMMRSEEFWASQEQQERQFVMGMAQSAYQFQKNLGLQYQELGLKEQELDIARERNSISRAEFNLRKSELQKEKNNTFLQAAIRDRLTKMREAGEDVGAMDILSFTTAFGAELGNTIPGFEIDAGELANMVSAAKTDVMNADIAVPAPEPTFRGEGGVFGRGGAVSTGFDLAFTPIIQGMREFYLGKR